MIRVFIFSLLLWLCVACWPDIVRISTYLFHEIPRVVRKLADDLEIKDE